MTDLNKFVKGKNLNSNDFNIDAANITIRVKTDATSSVGAAISSAIASIPGVAAATDTVQGKVSLAVAANYPSTSDTEAVTRPI